MKNLIFITTLAFTFVFITLDCVAQISCQAPLTYTVLRGSQSVGDLTSFVQSDNNRAIFLPEIDPSGSESPLTLGFFGVAPETNSFSIESHTNTPGITCLVEAWNWNTEVYDLIGTQAQSVNEESKIDFDINPAIHVDTNGNILARVQWRETGPVMFYPWQIRVDAFGFCRPDSSIAVTMNTAEHRYIGNVNEFEREKFISHHNTLTGFYQSQRDYLWRDLRILPTRTIGELIGFSNLIAVDGCLFDEASLAAAVDDTNTGLLSSVRYEPFTLIDESDNPLFRNAVIVRSGKANNQWPEVLRKDSGGNVQQHGPLNFAAYSQMMSGFYRDADLKLPMHRQYLEPANELWVSGFNEQQAIDLHVTMANSLHQEFPELNVGGPTQAWPRYNRNNFSVWGQAERFIQGAGDAIDFYSLHLYDWAERLNDGMGGAVENQSPTDATRTMAVLDLLEGTTLSELGTVKPLIISEYGMLNRGDTDDADVFPEDLQQWYVMRSVKDKVMTFMDRPDRIEVATPFMNVTTTWRFEGVDPALWPGIGNEVLFKGLASNHYETHLTKYYKWLRDVQGQYIAVDSHSPNLQVQAFRDGAQVHLLLNNISDHVLPINLNTLLRHDTSIQSATLKRLRLIDGVPNFEENIDVALSWQELELESEESAALTMTLAGPEVYEFAKRTRSFYSSERIVNILDSGAFATINAELDEAVSARLRVGLSFASTSTEETSGDLPDFTINLNNGAWTQMVASERIGREDLGMTVRQFAIPVAALTDGTNTIQIDTDVAGGHLIAAVLEIDQSLGDFNNNGKLDEIDRNLLGLQLGNPVNSVNDHFDLNQNGSIDQADLIFWDELRGQ